MDKQTFASVLIMLVAVPLIFRLVPRNWFYGFRTPRTLASDAVWYPANQVCGVALLAAGAAWFFWGMAAGVTGIVIAVLASVASLAVLPER